MIYWEAQAESPLVWKESVDAAGVGTDMIAIVDYGMGNLGSIRNMLSRLGGESVITSDSTVIRLADKLVLPGVGAFDQAMQSLRTRYLVDLLNERVLADKAPILGICLGMQLMTKRSDEGILAGLGWVDAETMRFNFDNATRQRLKIPHMGWDNVSVASPGMLFDGWQGDARFYFVHSYRVVCRDPRDIVATGHHGHEFVAAFQHDNIMGVQFHPEKSHRYGMELLRRFAEGEGES